MINSWGDPDFDHYAEGHSLLDEELLADAPLVYCKYGHYEEGNEHLPQCSNERFVNGLDQE